MGRYDPYQPGTSLPERDRNVPVEHDRLPASARGGHSPGSAGIMAQESRGRKPDDYAIRNADFSSFVFQATAASEQVMASNPQRAYLSIQNRGATAIYVGFSQNATSSGFRVAAGAFYEPYIAPSSSLYILGSAGGESVVVTEGVS